MKSGEKLTEDSTKLGLMKVAFAPANQIHYENLQAGSFYDIAEKRWLEAT